MALHETDVRPLARNGASRPILTLRSPGIERLLEDLPEPPEDRDELRRWTNSLTADASRFQVEQAKQRNALARAARGRG